MLRIISSKYLFYHDEIHEKYIRIFRAPNSNEYEYLGRLVTRERPIIRKTNSIQQNHSFPRRTQQYYRSTGSRLQEAYEDAHGVSSDDDIDDPDGLSKPVGVIRITDRHYRESILSRKILLK